MSRSKDSKSRAETRESAGGRTADPPPAPGAATAGPAEGTPPLGAAAGGTISPPEPVAPEALAQLKEQAAKAEEYLDLAKRARADFLNYQDRMRRELEARGRIVVEGFVREFLPALDPLRDAIRAGRSGIEGATLLHGVELIEKELLRIFAKSGVTPMECLGKKFDPRYHEVVSMEERDGMEPGTILEEVGRGWMLQDRVLRAASVVISSPKPRAGDGGGGGAPG